MWGVHTVALYLGAMAEGGRFSDAPARLGGRRLRRAAQARLLNAGTLRKEDP